MFALSRFQFAGNIARITPFDGTTKLAVVADVYRPSRNGERKTEKHEATLTVFGEGRRKFVADKLEVGDLIFAEGRIKNDSYKDRSGTVQYETSLIVDTINFVSRPDPTKKDLI